MKGLKGIEREICGKLGGNWVVGIEIIYVKRNDVGLYLVTECYC